MIFGEKSAICFNCSGPCITLSESLRFQIQTCTNCNRKRFQRGKGMNRSEIYPSFKFNDNILARFYQTFMRLCIRGVFKWHLNILLKWHDGLSNQNSNHLIFLWIFLILLINLNCSSRCCFVLSAMLWKNTVGQVIVVLYGLQSYSL